jgi:hypothetical protein
MTLTLFTKKFGLALANLMITAWSFTGGFAINYLFILISLVLNFKKACKELTKSMDFCKTGGEVNTWGFIIGTLGMLIAALYPIIIACEKMLKHYQQVVNFDEEVHQKVQLLDDEEVDTVDQYHSLIETIKRNFYDSNLITAAWTDSIKKDKNDIALVS